MSTISLRSVSKLFGGGRAPSTRSTSTSAPARSCASWPVRLRQDHDLAHDRRARDRQRRRHPDRRPARQRAGPGRARHRDGVPVLRPLPEPDRAREPGVPAARREPDRREVDGAGRAGRPHARPRPRCWTASRPACRRREAAGRGRPGHRARSHLLPVRRALVAASTSNCASRCAARSRRCCRASPRPP